MPKGENFWNPYRLVAVSNQSVAHSVPSYHHTMSGLSGRLWCDLEALTPLLIGDGRGGFVRHRYKQRPYIPATSLKGAMRSLAEVVGNAAVPFPGVSVDDQHALVRARKGSQFDTVARTFGYLHDGNVFAGLIRFSDAEMTEAPQPPNQWPKHRVAVGQAKPAHGAFYPGTNRRKFYHHHPGAKSLTSPHADSGQARDVQPAPPGTCFSFTMDFTNLRDAELSLLLYCLVLEEQVTVTLSPAALGPDHHRSATLNGSLRHKIGGAKPHGAGSAHIRLTKMQLRTDAKTRYQGNSTVDTWEAEALTDELESRTAPFRRRTDRTMQELRAMLIYCVHDPRKPVHYPTHRWFQDRSTTPLKPTI